MHVELGLFYGKHNTTNVTTHDRKCSSSIYILFLSIYNHPFRLFYCCYPTVHTCEYDTEVKGLGSGQFYFENVNFSHAKLGLDVCPVLPHTPEYCPLRLQTKHIHVLHSLQVYMFLRPHLHLCHFHSLVYLENSIVYTVIKINYVYTTSQRLV